MEQNTKFKVELTPEIRLEQALMNAGIKDAASVLNLVIVGTVTDDDFKYIRENMAKTLKELDMSYASVEGGKIGKWVFLDCTGLISVNISNSVTEIGEGAFQGCTKLSNVTIPDSVTTIENFAFYGCYGFCKTQTKPKPVISIPASVVTIKPFALCGCPAKDKYPRDKNKYEPDLDGPNPIVVHPDNPVYASENGRLKRKL